MNDSPQADPSKIIQVGLGFWASKTLLAAIKLKLFTALAKKPLNASEVQQELGLNEKGLYVRDFLDALASLGFLQREGVGVDATYSNTVDTDTFLDKNKSFYLGGFFEMANDREYRFWADLEEGLITGKPQNEIKYTGKESFEAIYEKPESLEQFTEGMSGMQKLSFLGFSQSFDFSGHKVMLDAGGSAGLLSSIVAKDHPHMQCITMDLPKLEPFAKKMAEEYGVADRVEVVSANFFVEPFPKADLITMGSILHSFDYESKQILLKQAYNALPEGGKLAIIEMILDDERKENTFGLLMSLNMLIESDSGFNYTQSEFVQWATEVGFKSVEFIPLGGPTSVAIAYK